MSSSIGDKLANSTYFLLYLLPFVLMKEKGMLKTLLIILIGFSVLVSFKRGGLISFSLALITYGWIDGKVRYNKHLISGKTLSYALVLFIAIYGANLLLDGYIVERFSSINESSRTELYPIVFSMIERSSLYELITGHGWNTVLRDNPLEYSAHNDVLECIYDFGIIGLLFYLMMIIGLIKLAVTSIKSYSKYAASLLSAIAIFLFQSMVSHIIIQITYFTLFALFFGYIYRQESRNLNTN
jgi:O-antigen ligase